MRKSDAFAIVYNIPGLTFMLFFDVLSIIKTGKNMPITISAVLHAVRSSNAQNPYFSLKASNYQNNLEREHFNILTHGNVEYTITFQGHLNIQLIPEHRDIKCRNSGNVVDDNPHGIVVNNAIKYVVELPLNDFSDESIKRAWDSCKSNASAHIQKEVDALVQRDTDVHNQEFLGQKKLYDVEIEKCQNAVSQCHSECRVLEAEIRKAKSDAKHALAGNTKTQKAPLTEAEQGQLSGWKEDLGNTITAIKAAQKDENIARVKKLQNERKVIEEQIKRLENKTEQVSASFSDQVLNYGSAALSTLSSFGSSGALENKKQELRSLEVKLAQAKRDLSAFEASYPEEKYQYSAIRAPQDAEYLLNSATIEVRPAKPQSVRHLVDKAITRQITRSKYKNIALCAVAVASSIGLIAYLGYSAYVWAMLTLLNPETTVTYIQISSMVFIAGSMIIGHSCYESYEKSAEAEILSHASKKAEEAYQNVSANLCDVRPSPSAPLETNDQLPAYVQ